MQLTRLRTPWEQPPIMCATIGIKGMAADVQRIVKNNPGPALLAAAALGFLLARTLSRD